MKIRANFKNIIDQLIKAFENKHGINLQPAEPPLTYEEMIFEINGLNYLPDPDKVQEVQNLVDHDYIYREDARGYLAAQWN